MFGISSNHSGWGTNPGIAEGAYWTNLEGHTPVDLHAGLPGGSAKVTLGRTLGVGAPGVRSAMPTLGSLLPTRLMGLATPHLQVMLNLPIKSPIQLDMSSPPPGGVQRLESNARSERIVGSSAPGAVRLSRDAIRSRLMSGPYLPADDTPHPRRFGTVLEAAAQRRLAGISL